MNKIIQQNFTKNPANNNLREIFLSPNDKLEIPKNQKQNSHTSYTPQNFQGYVSGFFF